MRLLKRRRIDRLTELASAPDPLARAREFAAATGGAFLGWRVDSDGHRRWIGAGEQASVLVLAPPRSGKTTGIVLPSLVAHPGPAVATSTKRDVLDAAAQLRPGTAWLFDPTGTEPAPPGVTRALWSPVTVTDSWDIARIITRAMVTAALNSPTGSGSNEAHFVDKAADLLAPLMLAANRLGESMATVTRWVYEQDTEAAELQLLSDAAEHDTGAALATASLSSVQRLADRERSSVFSTAQRVVSAYLTESAARTAGDPDTFDPSAFVESCDTLFIAAADDVQAAVAPVIVALLTAIKQATYARARRVSATGEPTPPAVLMLMDEAASCPVQELPAWLSQAGSHGLHLVVVFQSLAQAAAKWGQPTADELLTLCNTKLIFGGIGDPQTLRAVSEYVGNYDRVMQSATVGASIGGQTSVDGSASPMPRGSTGENWSHSTSRSYSTQRQALLEPGQIARLPRGRALLIQGPDVALVDISMWHDPTQPWQRITQKGHQ